MERKQYSNSFHTLEAIWRVLRRYSSWQHPLTVREIHEHLELMEPDPPSPSTLERALRDGTELMGLLFPGQAVSAGGGPAAAAYQEGDTLHVVVETPEGEPLCEEEPALEAAAEPFRTPGYSTVDKLLKAGIPFDLETFPCRLRCVARVPGRDGRPVVIPYDEWEDRLERRGREEKNNVPRRYYLASALTDGEWRMFADLVRDYPFISERQTRKYLRVLNRLNPKTPPTVRSQYAFKRGSMDRLRIIGILDKAITEKRKVRLNLGAYRLDRGADGWAPALSPMGEDGQLEIEPYTLMWANGNYYLVGKGQSIVNLRTDRILDAELLEESFEVPEDFDPWVHRDASPMMCSGRRTFVRLRCRETALGALVDAFGGMARYSAPREDGTVDVTMSVIPQGLERFALQHLDSVELLEPRSLRRTLADALCRGLEVYDPAKMQGKP